MTTLARKTFILSKCLCSILPEESTKNTTSVFALHPENVVCLYFETILKTDRQGATIHSYIKRRTGNEYSEVHVIPWLIWPTERHLDIYGKFSAMMQLQREAVLCTHIHQRILSNIPLSGVNWSNVQWTNLPVVLRLSTRWTDPRMAIIFGTYI